MKILDRYIVRETLGPFLMALAIFTFLLAVRPMMEEAEILLAKAVPPQTIGVLLAYLIPHYQREGKSYLTIAFGCTGGRHRSVTIAGALGRRLARGGYRPVLNHRDLQKAA